jgi:hypothetical protein
MDGNDPAGLSHCDCRTSGGGRRVAHHQFNVQPLRRLPRVSPPAGDGTPALSGESHPAILGGAGKSPRSALL